MVERLNREREGGRKRRREERVKEEVSMDRTGEVLRRSSFRSVDDQRRGREKVVFVLVFGRGFSRVGKHGDAGRLREESASSAN